MHVCVLAPAYCARCHVTCASLLPQACITQTTGSKQPVPAQHPMLRLRPAQCTVSCAATRCSLRSALPRGRAAPAPRCPSRWRAASRSWRLAARGDDAKEEEAQAAPLLFGYGGAVVGTLALAGLAALLGASDSLVTPDDALFGSGGASFSPGDVAGAGFWSVSLYYASPVQLLLLFLGRIDVERPSDGTLRLLGLAAGAPVDAAEYEAPQTLRVANAALFALAGTAVSLSLTAALGGEATWSVSTGLGACLAAGVYEVGRPRRLSGKEQVVLEEEWQQFRAFADARLVRKGRCHISEVDQAYRRHSMAYRRRAADESPVNAAGDQDLRNFIANWAPQAERSSGGFYRNLSIVEEATQNASPP